LQEKSKPNSLFGYAPDTTTGVSLGLIQSKMRDFGGQTEKMSLT